MKILTRGTAPLVAVAMLAACASSPKKIEAAYVSPIKYSAFTCDQLAIERTAIEYRANILYRSLKKRANADAAKMAAGAVLFLPTLLFLNGNGAKTAEFSDLKGNYQALRIAAEDKGCDIQFPDFTKTASGERVTADLVVSE